MASNEKQNADQSNHFQTLEDQQEVRITWGSDHSIYPCLAEKTTAEDEQEGYVELFNTTFKEPVKLYEQEFNEAVENPIEEDGITVIGDL